MEARENTVIVPKEIVLPIAQTVMLGSERGALMYNVLLSTAQEKSEPQVHLHFFVNSNKQIESKVLEPLKTHCISKRTNR